MVNSSDSGKYIYEYTEAIKMKSYEKPTMEIVELEDSLTTEEDGLKGLFPNFPGHGASGDGDANC